ncbi:MAG: hypothetical protein WKG32_09470 [Gemmatimonadaceae bacterium]
MTCASAAGRVTSQHAIARQYALLSKEISALIRRAGDPPDTPAALDVVHHLLDRSAETSERAYRHAVPAAE